MADSSDDPCSGRIDSISRRLQALKAAASEEAFRRQVGVAYVERLEGLSDSEAIEYLGSVDEARVQDAYLILSRRFKSEVLAQICIDYLRRPGLVSRRTGILAIVTCLKGTANRSACRALAEIVRDRNEEREIRSYAFWSMVLIDGNPAKLRFDRTGSLDQTEDELKDIDWVYVDSFLKGEGE